MSIASEALQRRVRVAARTLSRHGLAQAWGHCSARLDDSHFLVCAARPMGRIAVGEAGTIVPIDGALPDGVLGEVRIHQQIYKRRPEVGGVCRVMPAVTVALSILHQVPQPRHGVGAFNAACRLWEDPRLLRNDGWAAQLAEHMGDSPSLVMRANGAVTVGPCIELAVGFAWCLEDSAKMEQRVRTMAGEQSLESAALLDGEIGLRQVSSGRVFERLWEYLASDDAEFDAEFGEFSPPVWGSR